MKTPATKSTSILSQRKCFATALFKTGFTTALLLMVMGGCTNDDPGTESLCIIPTVISTSPAEGDSNVSLTKTSTAFAVTRVAAVKIISATFSTPMDPNSINTSTFTVRQGTDSIAGTVSYSDTTALFVVPVALAPNLTYTCTITTGVRSRSEGALGTNYVWTFTTIAPGTPTLVSPANFSVNLDTNPTLIWNAVLGASSYRLQVSLSPAFVGTVYDDSNLTGTAQQVGGLVFGETYYWRVNSKTSGVTSAYSSTWNFATLAPPAAPLLVSPVASAQNQSTSPTLSWNASTGAATYRLQVSTFATFATTVYNDSVLTGTSQGITGLAIGTTYYWRVNAKNLAGTSAYSTQSFTTTVSSLQAPLLAFPTDSAVNVSANPTLSWNASTGATTYGLQVSTVNTFATTVVNDSGLTGTSQALTGLTLGTTYYWRVNAKNGTGTSPYSTTWIFTVASAAAPIVNLGAAQNFGSMGGSAGITNQGIETQIHGSIGTTGASTLITGFHDATAPPSNVFTETPLNIGAVSDTIYTATAPPGSVPGAEATQSLAAAQSAYNYLKGLPPGKDPGAGELGGLTLAPGTYTSAGGTFKITLLDLTLDAQGDPNAQFVFQMASALTVGAASGARNVTLINGAQAKNVYWVVGTGGGGAATINGAGGGTMVGTIIAYSGVTFSTAGNVAITTLNGRALGLNAAVTMVNTVINVPAP